MATESELNSRIKELNEKSKQSESEIAESLNYEKTGNLNAKSIEANEYVLSQVNAILKRDDEIKRLTDELKNLNANKNTPRYT